MSAGTMGAASVAFLVALAPTVIQDSIRVSLTTTPPWTPVRLDTGEAVIGITLADPDVNRGAYSALYQEKVLNMYIDVLAALAEDPFLSSDRWARGKLAQYVMGIVAARQKETPTFFFGFNLVTILQKQLILSEDYFRTNRFALSLMAIALCQQKETFGKKFEDILTDRPGNYTAGIDEAAMITMACLCIKTQKCVYAAHQAEQFVSQNLDSGLDVYSLGLGAQALTAAGFDKHRIQIWTALYAIYTNLNIPQTMKNGLGVSQILPPFAKRSFLDIVNLPSRGAAETIPEKVIATNPMSFP